MPVLQNEQDLSTRRNAFQMLCNQATDRAVAYLMSQIDRVADWGDILQMAVLELIRKVRSGALRQLYKGKHSRERRKKCRKKCRKMCRNEHYYGLAWPGLQVCRAHPEQKGKYIKIILALLQSRSTAVVYECAVTLVSLSSAPTAVRAAANCFCQLLVSQSDNNVRLIVLDRLQVRLLAAVP